MVYFDPENVAETTRGQSLLSLFRNTIRISFFLGTDISYIDELIPEQEFAKKTGISKLIILSSVILHMLEFLCFRHVDSVSAQKSLDSLQFVVQRVFGGNNSWKTLGIK